MTRKEFSEKIVEKRIELIREVLQRKGLEYGAEKNAFYNFNESTGISFHDTNIAVAWEFCVKHLTSIKDMISNFENIGTVPSNEFIEEKFGDAINYMILMEGMMKEHLANKIEKLKFNEINNQ